jgi:hypothetical protein
MGIRVDNTLEQTSKLTIKSQAITRLIDHVYSPFQNQILKELNTLTYKNDEIVNSEGGPYLIRVFKDPVTGKVEGNASALYDPPLLDESLQPMYQSFCKGRVT